MAQTKSDLNARTTGSSDAIKSDIQNTRSEMDETLDELGQRLNPRRLFNDFLDMLSPQGEGGGAMNQVGTTLKQGSRSVSRYARQHPAPALLMAAGVAWAIYDAAREDEDDFDEESVSRRRQRRAGLGSSVGSPYVTASSRSLGEEHTPAWEDDEFAEEDISEASIADRTKQGASAMGSAVTGAASSVGQQMSSAASSAGGAASSVWRGSKRAGRRGYRQAGRVTSAAGHYARQGADSAREGIELARERFDRASYDYPLAVAGGFIAAGLLAGLILPRTKAEDEWMGDASDEVWDQAKSSGAELVEQGSAAAANTASAVMDEAEAQGLTPDELSKKVSRVAEKVSEAGKEAAQEEGLDSASMKEKSKKIGGEAATAAKSEAKGNSGAPPKSTTGRSPKSGRSNQPPT